MRRSVVTLAGAVLGLVMVAPAHADPRTVTYVVHSGGWGSAPVWIDRTASAAAQQELVLSGAFSHVPEDESFSIAIDDLAAPNGSAVPVAVSQGAEWLFNGCVPVRAPFTITGAEPEREMTVFVGGPYPYAYAVSCSAPATSGTLTIDG